jgi:hypothetical protein
MPSVLQIVQQRAEHMEATEDELWRAYADGHIDPDEFRHLASMVRACVAGQGDQIVELGQLIAFAGGGLPALANPKSRVNALRAVAKREGLLVFPSLEEVETDPNEAA